MNPKVFRNFAIFQTDALKRSSDAFEGKYWILIYRKVKMHLWIINLKEKYKRVKNMKFRIKTRISVMALLPTSPVPLGQLIYTSWVFLIVTGNINVCFKYWEDLTTVIYVDFINCETLVNIYLCSSRSRNTLWCKSLCIEFGTSLILHE